MVPIQGSGGINIDATRQTTFFPLQVADNQRDLFFIGEVLKDYAHIKTLATGRLLMDKLAGELRRGKRLTIRENLRAHVAMDRSKRRAILPGMSLESVSSSAAAPAAASAPASVANTGPDDDETGSPGLGRNAGLKGVLVTYDPSIGNYSLKSPSWLVLAHELIHALHYFQGTVGQGESEGVRVEEMITVGLGNFVNGEINENRLRAEANLEPRLSY